VFCSHRRADKPIVEAFARRMRQDGIDAWLDKWEIGPGDDVVKAIERGLDECEVGLVFLSSTDHPGGVWMGAEVSVLSYDRLEGRLGRVIPVLIDAHAPVPALLRPLDKRSIHEYEAIRAAVLGIGSKPPLGSRPPATQVVQLVLRAMADGAGGLKVELAEGDALLAAEGSRFPVGAERSLERFVAGRGTSPSPAWDAAEWRLLDQDLAELGRSLGAALFAGRVGEELAARIGALAQGEVVDLIYEAEGPLLSLPFEAARLPQRGGGVVALEPRVRVRRRPRGEAREPQPALAHPLKILVAVAAPSAELGGGPELDLEREQHTILAAVEEQASLGRAEVRVLEVASLERLGQALERDDYHVLHLSGHGRPGQVILEDEDFRAVPTGAAALAEVLGRAGRSVPLVVLSACQTAGPSAADPAGMAAALVAGGLDRVLAMQARVTDLYATALARGLYAPPRPPRGPGGGGGAGSSPPGAGGPPPARDG